MISFFAKCDLDQFILKHLGAKRRRNRPITILTRRAMVMIPTCAKGRSQRLVGSNHRVQTDERTDERTDGRGRYAVGNQDSEVPIMCNDVI